MTQPTRQSASHLSSAVWMWIFPLLTTSVLPLVLISVVALPLTAAIAAAQEESPLLLRLPPSFRSWTITPGQGAPKFKIAQFYAPVTATMRVGHRADLVVSGAAGFSSIKPDTGATQSLNGLNDVKVLGFVRFWQDRLLAQAGVSAPTGKKKLDATELSVAQLLGHPLLGFRDKRYGAGLDLNGGAALALPLGTRAQFGLGGGYTYHGPYTLLLDSPDYQPGAETSVSAGLDLHTAGAGAPDGPTASSALRLDLTYRTFNNDRLDSRDIYGEGDLTELSAEGRAGSTGAQGVISARMVLQADNTIYSADGAQISAIKTASGTATLLQGGVTFPLGASLRGGLDGEWTHFGGGDTGDAVRPAKATGAAGAIGAAGLDGNAYGGGPSVQTSLGNGGAVSFGVRYLTGTITGKNDAGDSSLTGLFLTLAVHWRAVP
jgi:hypothetical protein